MPAKQATARKRPKQARSQQTVAAILEATARILIDEGFERLNTNRVAQVAGVSIGSLYQYFPNKDALVLALMEEHISKQIEIASGLTNDLRNLPLRDGVRQFIRKILEATRVDAELHKTFITQVVHLGAPLVRKLHQQAEVAVRIALERRRDEILPKDLHLAAFFLVSTVDSIILRALTVADDRIALDDLEEELFDLVHRYLTGKS